MTVRSWASRTLSSFSGWEESEGGERSKVLDDMRDLAGIDRLESKSDVVSIVTEGAMAVINHSSFRSRTLLEAVLELLRICR